MPHDDFDELFEALVGFAEQMLDEHGAFHPFAVAVDSEGELAHVAPPEDQVGDDQPQPEQLVEILTAIMKEHAAAGTIRACGLCVDVVVIPPDETEQVDAIHIHMEHANGEVFDVFTPYRVSEDGELEMDEPFAEEGDAAIFDADK